MAYASYTSTSPNPPFLLAAQPIAMGASQSTLSASGAGGGNLWIYNSTHLQTDVGSSDFIGDGTDLGLRAGDILLAIGASGLSMHRCSAVGSTYTSFSAGLLVSSAS